MDFLATKDEIFTRWREEGLVWLPERGMGRYPVTEQPYDEGYFEKYREYANTELGRELTAARVSLVNAYTDGEVVDVGIGCGQFVETRGGQTWGYDINPAGVQWLTDRGLWRNPRERKAEALTFWDVLEHIPDPGPILANAGNWVFVSLPIFTGIDHVLRSKHFRKDEHCWYWTRDGLIQWMMERGFTNRYRSEMESELGREDIETFVFERVHAATSGG